MTLVIVLLVINAVLLAFIAIRLDAGIAAIQRTIMEAANANFASHGKLLGHFEKLERQRAGKEHEERMRQL